MASTSWSNSSSFRSSNSSPFLPQDHESVDPESLRTVVNVINRHMDELLLDARARKSLRQKCYSKLKIQKQDEFFEFSEQSVVSNLYWGIENAEAAIGSKSVKEKNAKLNKSEKMLQAPALLDEHGTTAGIPNSYLVCCSYFFLALVKGIQRDELQVAIHFLQALSVSPRLVDKELAPELFAGVVMVLPLPFDENGSRHDEEAVRSVARSYKAWLMYYQVMSYGGGDDKQSRQHVDDEQAGSGLKRLQDVLMEYHSDSSADDFENSMSTLVRVGGVFEEDEDRQDEKEQTPYSKSNELGDIDEDTSTWRNCLVSSYQSGASAEAALFSRGNHRVEQAEILEKVISNICFSGGMGREDDDSSAVEIKTIYEMLATKTGLKYSLLKDVILDQLLLAISTSKEEGVTRASVSLLSSIISGNPSVIDEIKRKGLRLCDLANALRKNVYEAATLIYLINPSPAEIKTLELLPVLVEIVCTSNCYKRGLKSLLVTPPSASLMIIEVLVTAFDYSTNNAHLEAISSPKVLSCLLNIPRNDNMEEFVSLAAILVRCMRFNGQCRSYISQLITSIISPFISLLISNQKRATFVALEFFHEVLRIPRSSAINLLKHIRDEGHINVVCALLLSIQQSQPEYKLLAANLLLQLDVLEDDSVDDILNRQVAAEALLESLTCEESSSTQQLSAFILSNLGGTFSWTGEPYTVAWLVKKGGLTSLKHKNIIRNVDWSDHTLQEEGTDRWCSRVARRMIKLGNPVFYALQKGLKSKNRRVSKDCLTAVSWLGCEVLRSGDDVRCSACDILLSTIEQYVHPGLELEDRFLACLCIYNYTSGRGMQKLIQLSEGVRESLRRLSSVTWMAEELLKVADYYLPNKWRISCVHTQTLEASHNHSGAVNALIYYRGELFGGYADGSIKVWNTKGQTSVLAADRREHKKAVTCFSLLESGNYLLSGSADKTIRVWHMVERKLECIEVIPTKESIRSLETFGELIFAVTHSHRLKVIDASRKVKDVCKSKHVKCIKTTSQGKVYIGCMDSSIQELTIANDRLQEIKAPSRTWTMQNKPINSIALYKDWLYCASTSIEGSKTKEWKRQCKPQMSIVPEKRATALAMSAVEDFIYLNCTSSGNSIEIWLRGAQTQHKVGRLSAGSKITSLLTANDMILCGTETGLIKGWIPL